MTEIMTIKGVNNTDRISPRLALAGAGLLLRGALRVFSEGRTGDLARSFIASRHDDGPETSILERVVESYRVALADSPSTGCQVGGPNTSCSALVRETLMQGQGMVNTLINIGRIASLHDHAELGKSDNAKGCLVGLFRLISNGRIFPDGNPC